MSISVTEPRPARIMAKNLLLGDRYILSGNRRGKVVKIKANAGADLIEINVAFGRKGKTFTATRRFEGGRVWVIETAKRQHVRRVLGRIRAAMADSNTRKYLRDFVTE